MQSVRDYRNNPNPISFSEFKRLINGIDEKRYGRSWVYVGADNQCPVVDFSAKERPPVDCTGGYRSYFTGPKHAGENLADVLKRRAARSYLR